MKEYARLAKKITFSLKDVIAITGNESTATSMMSRMLKKGYVKRMRKDLYSCVNVATGDVIADMYQIATAIHEDSYVSHHSACEFHGFANQVYHTVYVSSMSRFNTFEFMGITYTHVKSHFTEGVMNVKNIEDVKVTDRERTYIDSVNLVSKIGGVEELIHITEAIDTLDVGKLLKYLEKYGKKVLYQKTGFFLQNYYQGVDLGNDFFRTCRLNSGNSVRYLMQGREGQFNSKWNLVVPDEYITRRESIGEPDEYI